MASTWQLILAACTFWTCQSSDTIYNGTSDDVTALLQQNVHTKTQRACACTNPPTFPSTWCGMFEVCLKRDGSGALAGVGETGCCGQQTPGGIMDVFGNIANGNTAPPNPFYQKTGIPMTDILLGLEQADIQQCGDFVQKMMQLVSSSAGTAAASASSGSAAAMQQLITQLFQGADYAQSMKCLKFALDYADKKVLPTECILPGGDVDPACCTQEKRCSTTNPLDGCPWTVFGVGAKSVTCVGSHQFSPVPTGVCKCMVGTCGARGQGCLPAGSAQRR